MEKLLLEKGFFLTPEGVKEGALLLEGERIVDLLSSSEGVDARKVDLQGRTVIPGAIDVHAHLNDPGFTWRETFEQGSQAAAAGGVTTIVDMPLQNEPAVTNRAVFDRKKAHLAGRAYVDFALWGGVFDSNLDDLEAMHEAGAPAFKVFVGPVSPDYQSLNMGVIRQALAKVRPFDGLLGFHAEDYSIIKGGEKLALEAGRLGRRDFLDSRPVVAELVAVASLIELAREFDNRIHICHVSHPDVAQMIKEARDVGLRITAETCSHYLTFTEDDVLEKGMLFKCAPPLRGVAERERLWDYVVDGTLGCVASDHSPCAPREKDESEGAFKAWGGISGIQSLVPVFLDGARARGLSLDLISRRLSEGPAKIFGLWGRKGAIAPGFDADFAVLDLEKEWLLEAADLFYLNKISAFVGCQGRGTVEQTWVRGRKVYDRLSGFDGPSGRFQPAAGGSFD